MSMIKVNSMRSVSLFKRKKAEIGRRTCLKVSAFLQASGLSGADSGQITASMSETVGLDDLHCATFIAALIAAVEKKPGIYDKSHPDYRKEEKERLWLEICADIVPNWNDISLSERNSRVILIQRKWKNLRDNFRKEFKIINKLKPPRSIKRKREYIYFKSMQFLEPYMLDSEDLRREDKDDDDTLKLKRKLEQTSFDSSNIEFWEDTQNADSNCSSNNQKTKKHKKPVPDNPVVETWENLDVPNDISNYSLHEDIDEDRYFLLSLLPSLRCLSGQQKLSVRVEFLQILQRISFSDNNDPLANI